jgi:uncharacterized iron-regulated protein
VSENCHGVYLGFQTAEMNKIYILVLTALITLSFKGEDKPAYQLFTADGKKTSYSALLAEAKKADIVLFGELHDNPIAHWLELEITKDLHKTWGTSTVMGAEMFEADNQAGLNLYLEGKIADTSLSKVVRLWPNYETDYRPLVDFAKENKIPFIASNTPRKYANMVYRKGFDALTELPDSVKRWFAPLPIPYDSNERAYKEIFENSGGHGGQNLPKSQALKDATMGWNISQNWAPGKHFIHFHGSYHSDNRSGITWYLSKYILNIAMRAKDVRPRVLVISTTLQPQISTLNKESNGQGDYILCIPESMTRTY